MMNVLILICMIISATVLVMSYPLSKWTVGLNNKDVKTMSSEEKKSACLCALPLVAGAICEIIVMVASFRISQTVFFILLGMYLFSLATTKYFKKSVVLTLCKTICSSIINICCYYYMLKLM